MTTHYREAKKLPPFDRCIYCNAAGDGVALTSEHIVPFFLGGNVEILKASCGACQEITKQIEAHCAYKVFYQHRHGVGIKSRRKVPASIPVQFETDSGIEVRDVPLPDQPQIMTLPIFPEPGMLVGRPPRGQMEPEIMTGWISQAAKERFDRSQKSGDIGYSLVPQYDVNCVARFVAKVGLAAAVGMFGYDPAKSWLGPIVTGRDQNVDFLIGSLDDPKNSERTITAIPRSPGDSHDIGFFHAVREDGADAVLVAHLNFFTRLAAPKYLAVVGPITPEEFQASIAGTRK